MAALAGGAAAVMAVGLLVVSMTPGASSGPVALSATTTPILERATISAAPRDPAAASPTPQRPLARVQSVQLRTSDTLLASMSSFPHSVTKAPQLDLDGADVAGEPPQRDDIVFVRTDAVTYEVRWDHAQSMLAPNGSVVFDADGQLLAYVVSGELVTLVGG